jgi:hypothetical protein
MLASELAEELKIDPSVMSKRLGVYFQETGQEKTRILSEQAANHLRSAHELLTTSRSHNFKTAVQMVIGTFTEPVPPESVRLLERRLENLETMQAQTLETVKRILEHVEKQQLWESLLDQQTG